MKNLFLIVAFIFATMFSYAQQQTIKVIYTEKMDLSERLKDIDDPMIKKMLVKKLGKEENYVLYSKNGVSRYEKAEDNNTELDQGITVMAQGGSDKDIIYRNQKEKKITHQAYFLTRYFLIEDSLEQTDWKITNDTLTIGGYSCRKATANVGGSEKTAWFTNEIPINEGPEMYFGLPGLILKVEAKNKIIIANNVSFVKEDIAIKPPKKGKKMTSKKFETLKKEKLKEFTGGKPSKKGVKIIQM